MNVWNGNSATSFVYYEDDGHTYDYEKGSSYKRLMTFDPINKKIVLNKKEGLFNSRFSSVQFVLHGFGQGDNFEVNGKNVSASTKGKEVVVTTGNSVESVVLRW